MPDTKEKQIEALKALLDVYSTATAAAREHRQPMMPLNAEEFLCITTRYLSGGPDPWQDRDPLCRQIAWRQKVEAAQRALEASGFAPPRRWLSVKTHPRYEPVEGSMRPQIIKWLERIDDAPLARTCREIKAAIIRLEERQTASVATPGDTADFEINRTAGNGGTAQDHAGGTEAINSNTDLAPSRMKAKSAHDWAMQTISGADKMTIAELHQAIMDHPQGPTDCIPDKPETFGKYLRDAGVKRYDSKGVPHSRNIHRSREL